MACKPRAEKPRAERPRVGYLGPQGTFTEEALFAGVSADAVQPIALDTIYDTIDALSRGEVDWAIAPIENSLDGSVTVTLDLLAGHAGDLQIVGEELLKVRHCLIGATQMPLGQIDTVLTHPQVPGQCRTFLRGTLPHAQVVAASSTADATRLVSTGATAPGAAAIGTRLAATIYGGVILAADIQDSDANATRFVWLARPNESAALPLQAPRTGGWKTSLVFWGAGADRSGWLVGCLDEFGRREINLTKIESRPRRAGMGHYMFFVDIEGPRSSDTVAAALQGLAARCEQVHILGSYQLLAAQDEA